MTFISWLAHSARLARYITTFNQIFQKLLLNWAFLEILIKFSRNFWQTFQKYTSNFLGFFVKLSRISRQTLQKLLWYGSEFFVKFCRNCCKIFQNVSRNFGHIFQKFLSNLKKIFVELPSNYYIPLKFLLDIPGPNFYQIPQ